MFVSELALNNWAYGMKNMLARKIVGIGNLAVSERLGITLLFDDFVAV